MTIKPFGSFLVCIKMMNFSDEIKATKISSRLNKGNKDLTGQVGQAGQADVRGLTRTAAKCWRFHLLKIFARWAW